MQNMNRIDLFLDALEQAFATAGKNVPWPVHIGSVAPYFSDHEASDLFSKLRQISKEHESLKILRKLQIGPTVTKGLLMDLIVGLKVTKPPITVDERVWFVEYMFDAIEKLQYGDIFCRDGRNLILGPSEVQDLYEETPWIWLDSPESNQELGRSIYKASAGTNVLKWSLYFYGWGDVGYETHGPYEVTADNGRKFRLVIRDFSDPKPTLLWKSMESFPYDSIQIMALHDWETELTVNIFGHLIDKRSLLDTTVALYLEANGVPSRTLDTVEALTKCVLDRVIKQQSLIDTMSKEEVIKKFVEGRYYAFRRWRWYFQEDWYPPKEVLQRIEKWGIIEIPEGEGPTWEALKKAFDPRTDFVPGRTTGSSSLTHKFNI